MAIIGDLTELLWPELTISQQQINFVFLNGIIVLNFVFVNGIIALNFVFVNGIIVLGQKSNIIQNIQKSTIPKTSFLVATFSAVSYSKTALDT